MYSANKWETMRKKREGVHVRTGTAETYCLHNTIIHWTYPMACSSLNVVNVPPPRALANVRTSVNMSPIPASLGSREIIVARTVIIPAMNGATVVASGHPT
jgi:hypothetical protein